jgi:hypothetical protein
MQAAIFPGIQSSNVTKNTPFPFALPLCCGGSSSSGDRNAVEHTLFPMVCSLRALEFLLVVCFLSSYGFHSRVNPFKSTFLKKTKLSSQSSSDFVPTYYDDLLDLTKPVRKREATSVNNFNSKLPTKISSPSTGNAQKKIGNVKMPVIIDSVKQHWVEEIQNAIEVNRGMAIYCNILFYSFSFL